MNTKRDMVKIAVKLKRDEEGYPPVDWEDLWAISLGNDTFEIDNVPFYAPGISSGDHVSAVWREGSLVFLEVVEPKGHSTIRVVVYTENSTQRIRNELRELGCSTELGNIADFFSVDVPPQVDYSRVENLLAAYAEAGDLDYEESAFRHASGK